MKLFGYSMKHIRSNPWRSVALGGFLFIASLILILMNSYVSTIRSNMFDSFINAVTGHVQLQSSRNAESDMITVGGGWNGLSPMDEPTLTSLGEVVESGNYGFTESVRMVRTMGALRTASGEAVSMVLGMEQGKGEGAGRYQRSLELTEGAYLDPSRTDEIILSTSQAEELDADVGDTVTLAPSNAEAGTGASLQLKVVGIGKLSMLELFDVSIAYTNLAAAQQLAGYDESGITDWVFYENERNQALHSQEMLKADLDAKGIGGGLSITTWEDMGGFIMGGIQLYSVILYGFIAVLLFIIGLLLINMVGMIGLQRRMEVGTLRAIGFGREKIVRIFMNEILTITVVASLLGTLSGTLLIQVLSRTGIETVPPLDFIMGKVFYIQLDIKQLIIIPLLMIGFSAVASLYPAVKAASLQPAEVLKEN